MLPPELLLLAQICTKSFVSWGFAPDPTGGRSPDPLAGLGGGAPGEREGGREGEKEEGESRNALIQSWQAYRHPLCKILNMPVMSICLVKQNDGTWVEKYQRVLFNVYKRFFLIFVTFFTFFNVFLFFFWNVFLHL